jgi:hypothetical protein
MNDIILQRNHDRPQRISYRNDVLFGATVYQSSKKRPRKKIDAGKFIVDIYTNRSYLNIIYAIYLSLLLSRIIET